ncbi:NAD(P)H:quinone oxidoreductase [Pseudoalteromonas sp. T1lg75]|uniref:NAD(P)H:quinone oxidoreductase n=1 Tax=Pseudoalteromonas sp. T1lg75 TaxID=2077102 RepID=UPI000CF5FBEA|nr:NAD(P)H:quinone oxidoreductase [Pseudoalteromonas sp. T1lg75]
MAPILVLYHSRSGSVQALAEEIADSIEAQGCDVWLRCIGDDGAHPQVNKQELIDCAALAFGTPTRFGMMASQAKSFWEQSSDLWLKGQLIDKPACVFTSSSSMHGGNETTLLHLSIPLLHHGMLLVGVPYDVPALNATTTGGAPYGASHVAGLDNNSQLSSDEKQICQALGRRLANLARKLND